jgi:protein-S-isoprenylcysteine O-methyltransferase Ste14
MIALRTLIYSLLVPMPVTVLVPWWLLTIAEPRLWSAPWRWLGILPIAIGAALYFWCAWNFTVRGGGTPNPADPPRRLVAQGPYRLVRNPMYVACTVIIAGECVFTGAPWLLRYLAGTLLVVEGLVRLWEEPQMRRRYGEDYARYCAEVGRWFPRLRRLGA